jgi:23S rRNA maturation mini-RNase III
MASGAYPSSDEIPRLLDSFVRAGTSNETGLLSAGHQSLSRVAAGLLAWVADWQDYGLEEACRRLHVQLKPGLSAEELAGLLVQVMAPISALRQDVAIRRAVCRVIDDLVAAAPEDGSDISGLALTAVGDDAYWLIVRLVAYYIYEVFVSSLDGQLLQQLSDRKTDQLAEVVEYYVLVRAEEMILRSKNTLNRHQLRGLAEEDIMKTVSDVYDVFLRK